MVKLKMLNALKHALGAKFKLVFFIGISVLIIFVFSVGYNIFGFVRNILFTEPGIQAVSIDVLDEIFKDVFNTITLEIETSNLSVLTIVPGGFVNPGTITFILQYDSTVLFGVRDADRIRMRRIGDILFVEASSINIDVLSASVRNFRRTNEFKSNPMVRRTQAIVDEIFAAQKGYEETAAQRLNNERNRETARRNFMAAFEAVSNGVGLTVIWE
ncbi:MAG: hypothetical protein FWE90_00485 [Defluviitaleaceae bacterium]|nr:hypothetical protein [Defluviitaleaceae bacterium]